MVRDMEQIRLKGRVFNLMRVLKNKNGQALVEFALVLPLFLMLTFAVIDLGWMMNKYLTFDYAYRNASWTMSISYDSDYSQTISGESAKKAIKEAMKKTSSLVDEEDLSVSDAKLKCWTEKKDYYTPKSGGGTDQNTKKWRYAQITASLVYTVEPLTPVGKVIFGEQLTFTKNLEKNRLIMTKEG